MPELSPATLTTILVGFLLFSLFLGTPVALAMGGVAAIVMALLTGGLSTLTALPLKVWNGMYNFNLAACPAFIFMGVMMERSGIAGALFESMHKMARGSLGHRGLS